MIDESASFRTWISGRRSVREFSSRAVPAEVIENCIMAAAAAPSGANKQPWSFCLVGDPVLKREIRHAAEEEERRSYQERMPDQWLNDLEPLGTNWMKPFLETAPWLIVVFRKTYDLKIDGRHTNYYVQESVGISCGILLCALYKAGLASLTHTPSPMNFLSRLLERPPNEKPFLLIPVGYPSELAMVPDIGRKAREVVLFRYG
jgi:nitroreductase